MKNSKKAQETAETRMAIIAPLLAPGLDKDSVRNLRKTIVETSHVSQRTLDRYLHAYHSEGFNGLLPEGKNTGTKYKIPLTLWRLPFNYVGSFPAGVFQPLLKFWRWRERQNPVF
jgi:hypothetical protein